MWIYLLHRYYKYYIHDFIRLISEFCAVLTCRAKRTLNFHYFPKRDREMHKKWVDAIYHGEPFHRFSKTALSVCRRHFTEDDYLDPPCKNLLLNVLILQNIWVWTSLITCSWISSDNTASGGARRLVRGAVPSVNIPICRAEVRLARLKLHLDLNRRKAEERNLSFSER